MLNRYPISTILFLVLTSLSLLARPLTAGEIPKPTGPILLTITGNISNLNHDGAARFDLQMLENMEVTRFSTNTPWTQSSTEFTGVRLSVLLDYVGAQSGRLRATAQDKYWFDMDTSTFSSVPVIVAYKKNGEYMRVRNQGPLWIMFPFDEHPDQLTETNKNSCVWHLIEIIVL